MEIREGNVDDAIEVSKNIPEFDNPYGKDVYDERLEGRKHLILVMYDGEKPVGFKVGYELSKDSFYSWMGGVIPEYRNKGVAADLAEYQEGWCLENGFRKLTIKTRNKFRGMLVMLIKSGYDVVDVDQKDGVQDYRILLEKSI